MLGVDEQSTQSKIGFSSSKGMDFMIQFGSHDATLVHTVLYEKKKLIFRKNCVMVSLNMLF